jgi:protein-export membrane protein SecD/preprotein translocase SecF subunit
VTAFYYVILAVLWFVVSGPVFGLPTAYIALRKNQRPWLWGGLATLFGPLATIAVAVQPRRNRAPEGGRQLLPRSVARAYGLLVVLAFALVNVYPTIGWMTITEDARQGLIAQWNEEDRNPPAEDTTFGPLTRAVQRWREYNQERVINLGLDLQGGIHMVLGLDMDEFRTSEQYRIMTEVEGLPEDVIVSELQQTVVQRVLRRISQFEVKEPTIQALGDDQIQIMLPGAKDLERATALVKKTAFLTFHMAAGQVKRDDVVKSIDTAYPNRLKPFLRPPTFQEPSYTIPFEHIDKVKDVVADAEAAGFIDEAYAVAFSGPPNPGDRQQYILYVIEREPSMTGEGLTRAVARPNQQTGTDWMIYFDWGPEAAVRFGNVTANNIGRSMAIVLDGEVASAPTIQSRIFASGQITGSFSREQAQDVSIALNSGSMPVPLIEQRTGVVDASLGAESIRKGVLSALAGLAFVVAFMFIYYHVAGVVANVALLFNGVLVLAALAYFDATLTLPGIAGLILTIGMAVDANVLIFERIREEIRNGKSLKAAINSGYERATVTILDANITTLIAAAVLRELGSGPIEGFAVTLSVGVCTSVFTALIVTRAIFDVLTTNDRLSRLTMLSIVRPGTKIKFMSARRIALTVSLIAIVLGMGVFGARSFDAGKSMYGVDFTTGTNMAVSLKSDVELSEIDVRDALANADFHDTTAVAYAGKGIDKPNQFLISVSDVSGGSTVEGQPDTIASQVQAALAGLAGGVTDNVELISVDTVGPAVGRQLKIDTARAIAWALILIIAYLWFRFEWKFAIGAVVALAHDVLIVMVLFALTGKQISLAVVAAVLTIIGYSLNDTIVVFDRVREDLRLYRGRDLSYPAIMDLSINQTLGRTLLTSVTTLIVVVILYIFGGAAINDFSFALIVGVIVGTYSSVFVASPVVNFLQWLREHHPGLFTLSFLRRRKTETRGRGKKKASKTGKKAAT